MIISPYKTLDAITLVASRLHADRFMNSFAGKSALTMLAVFLSYNNNICKLYHKAETNTFEHNRTLADEERALVFI